jgi:RND family efflux transporter MFP subunit
MRGLIEGSHLRAAVAALAVLLLGVTGAGCKADASAPPAAPPPREIEVLEVKPTLVRDTGDYLGTLLSRGSVTVLPQVSGYVRKIHVRPGQRVKVGDPLLEIDSRVEAAALASSRAQQSSTGARLELARQAMARAEALYKEGLATAEEFEQRRAEVAAAEAATQASRAEVSQQRVRLQYNLLRAAVPGVIGDVATRLGDYLSPTTPVTTIAGSTDLELTVAVPAARARRLAAGAPIEVLRADGSLLVATTAFYIAPEANPRTQLIELKAMVPGDLGLRSSELVRTRVVFATSRALELPLSVIARQSGQAFVFAVVDGKGGGLAVERRPVTLGPLTEHGYVVEEQEHLKTGDRIAVSSLQLLRDGAAVKIAAPREVAAGAAPAAPAAGRQD